MQSKGGDSVIHCTTHYVCMINTSRSRGLVNVHKASLKEFMRPLSSEAKPSEKPNPVNIS